MNNIHSNTTFLNEAIDKKTDVEDEKTDLILANMIDLRKTMSDVLSLLLGAKKNSVIDQALFRILQFFDVDRVYIGTFDEQTHTVDFTNEVTCDGIISMREDLLRQLPQDEIPWWYDSIKKGMDIVIHDVSKMPEEAKSEQHLLILQEVSSLLVIPIFKQGKPSGFIGFDSVKKKRNWSALDIENLHMLADILSIAIERGEVQGLVEHTAMQVMKSETKFKIIFDKMPWGAELYDENGVLVDINQADLDIFGVTREQAVGLNMFENPNIPKYVNQSLKNGKDIFFPLNYDFKVASQNGYYDSHHDSKTKHLLVKGVTLKDSLDNIFGYIYIVFDDTENHIKREQIENSLARLKVSVDTGDSILWEYDVENDKLTVDFGLNEDINNNEGLKAIHDYNFKNQEDYKSSIHPDDFDRVYNKQFKPLLQGKINNFVAAYRRILNGKTFWFNSNVRSYKFNDDGTPNRIVSYTSNITQQREKEIELIKVVKGVTLKDSLDNIFGYIYIVFDDTENHIKREQIENSLARLKVSVDTGDSILWEYDVENDKLTVDFGLNEDINNNEGLKAIHDYNFKNQEDYKSSIHPDDFDRVYNKQFKPLLQGKINNFVAAYRRILNGKTFWFNSNVRSYKFNDDGTPNRIVSYTSNITQQREKEIELIKVKEADKLKSAFLANMSHEIRTPLNAIVGFSNIIAEIDDEVERQSYLDIIHKNNDLLLQLIDDILDFSKIEAGTMDYHFEEVDIKDICGEIALADSIKMPSDVVLIFDLGSPSVIVKTDERRVMQVISNFVNNAIKFTTKGSITIYYEIEGDFIRVCVKDTGIGISAENQRRIFERFIKVDTFQQGTGLGLTISRTIIEALGGKIGVDSEEGVGSTFWFTLPLDTKRTDIELSPDIPVQSEETPRSDRHHSILIAEDVYENYFLLETLFGKQYQLYHALNGQEAIDMFETYHPDLILMDIKMPVMDGFEATRRIRTLSKTIPIIALTAFAFEREKEIAKQCEFTDYVVKPIDIKELKKLIVKVLA